MDLLSIYTDRATIDYYCGRTGLRVPGQRGLRTLQRPFWFERIQRQSVPITVHMYERTLVRRFTSSQTILMVELWPGSSVPNDVSIIPAPSLVTTVGEMPDVEVSVVITALTVRRVRSSRSQSHEAM